MQEFVLGSDQVGEEPQEVRPSRKYSVSVMKVKHFAKKRGWSLARVKPTEPTEISVNNYGFRKLVFKNVEYEFSRAQRELFRLRDKSIYNSTRKR